LVVLNYLLVFEGARVTLCVESELARTSREWMGDSKFDQPSVKIVVQFHSIVLGMSYRE